MKTKIYVLIVFLCLFAYGFSINQKAIEVQTSSKTSTYIKFHLPEYKIENSTFGNQNYKKIVIEGSEKNLSPEEADLPFFFTSIAVPRDSKITVNVIKSEQEESIKNVSIQPSDLSQGNLSYLNRKDINDQNVYQISEVMTLRDYQVLSINIYPFKYDGKNRELRAIHQIELNITHQSGTLSYTNTNVISPNFEKLYRALISNYDQIRNPSVSYQKPSILIIHPNNNDINPKLNQLIEWKRQKGYYVKAVSTTQTGLSTSSIKQYILSEMNNSENPPEYILLVGDTSGSLSIPTYYSYYDLQPGAGDYPYTHLFGTDTIGDAFIGRLSVSDVNQFNVMVSKILFYEKSPNIEGTEWMNKSILMGESNVSGESCIHTNLYIKEVIKAYDPNHTFSELYGSTVNQSTTVNTATQGALDFHYRGYYNMNNFTNSHINNINNNRKLFNVVWITCNTGAFGENEESRIERVTRLGLATELRGAITAVGMSTSHTLTAYNNILSSAIYEGVYTHGLSSFGEGVLYSKIRLLQVYYNYSGVANDLAQWMNIMGDPSVSTYRDVPKSFYVTCPDSILTGQNTVQIAIKDNLQNPISEATATLKTSNNEFYWGKSDNNGNVVFNINSDLLGNLTLTVSKDNYLASFKTIIQSSVSSVSLDSYTFSNATNTETVNTINPNSNYVLNAIIKNRLSNNLSNFTVTLRTQNPYVTITDSIRVINQLNSNQISSVLNFPINIHSNCPNLENIIFVLDIYASGQHYYANISKEVNGFNINLISYNSPVNGQYVPIGVTSNLSLTLKNLSHVNFEALELRLSSLSSKVNIIDSVSTITNFNINDQVSLTSDMFEISVLNTAYPNTYYPLSLQCYQGDQLVDTKVFSIRTQNSMINDPLGPDQYGYLILDQNDLNYSQVPTYNWVEISSLGTNIGLYDTGDNQDSILGVDLPFQFRFYGQNYQHISISSNGFFVFGNSSNPAMRNMSLPGSSAPVNIVAPYWADLIIRQQGTNGVYTYYDVNNHYFVIQWNNARAFYYKTGSESPNINFQVILYDSQYYPNMPIDGVMKFQYKDFHPGFQGSNEYPCNFFTTGIQNSNATSGLTYLYNNQYASTCPTLSNQKALFITTLNNSESISTIFSLPLQITSMEDQITQLDVSPYIENFNPDNANLYTLTCTSSSHITTSVNGLVVTFSPQNNWSGNESLLFTLTTPQGEISNRFSTIKVIAVNDPPYVINPVSQITFNDNNTYNSLNLFSVFSDPDINLGDHLTFTFSTTTHLTINVNTNGQLIVVPEHNWSGSEMVTFTATDDSLMQVSHSITFNVIDVNEPPVINFPSLFNINEDQSLDINLQNYVSDIDNDFEDLDISVTGSGHIGVVLNNNILTIQPIPNYNGNEYIRITVSDQVRSFNPTKENTKQSRLSVTDSVLVHVISVNDPPIINACTPDTTDIYAVNTQPVTFTINASDIDTSTLYYYWTINNQNQQTYTNQITKTFLYEGEYVVNCRVSDGYSYVNHSWNVHIALNSEINPITTTELLPNSPNPFNPETKISYQLKEKSRVEINIYNIKGQIVKQLVNEEKEKGKYSIIWNGEDQYRNKVSSGVYYYEMKTEGFRKIQKMLLLK